MIATIRPLPFWCLLWVLFVVASALHAAERAAPEPWDDFIRQTLSAYSEQDFHASAALYRQLLAQHHTPRPSLRLIWSLERLSAFQKQQQQLAQAEETQAVLLKQMEILFGPFDILLVAPLSQLATLQQAQNHLAQAKQTLEQALTIADESNHSTPLLTIPLLQQLLILQRSMENNSEADRLQQRIYDIQEQALTMDSPGDAIILAHQGKFQLKNGHKESAASLFQQSKEILLESSGPYHSARADVLYSLATLLIEEEEYAQAVELLKSALAISENMRGTHHPDLLPILQRLAFAYQKMAKANLSRPVLSRTLSLMEERYGQEHEKTAEAILALADNLRLENQPDPAIDLYNRALAIFRHRELPAGIARGQISQAKAMKTLGKLSAAIRNLRDAAEWAGKLPAGSFPEQETVSQQLHALLALQEDKLNTSPSKTVSPLHPWRQLQEHLTPLGTLPFLPTPPAVNTPAPQPPG
ncbi:MAG: tetratricopeptide repeat protein [Magnetococcales bacterium]|nr:tetratricopeptide repeat protein [Magnetococcales bacterium]